MEPVHDFGKMPIMWRRHRPTVTELEPLDAAQDKQNRVRDL